MCKNVAKSFGSSKKIRTFASMKREEFVITAISRLTGDRVEISGPMPHDAAVARLQRELDSRRRQRYPIYTRLRVERRLPVQLTIKFNDYEKRSI